MDPSMMAGQGPQLKSADDVIKGLGLMYKECHAIDGSGQACEAIKQIMQAVSEVANNIGSMGQGGQPSPQHQDPFMQAGQNVADQMSGASAQQGPPPGGGY